MQLNGTALLKLKASGTLRFSLPTGDACLPAGAGYLVPCPHARAAATDVTISMRMWPLHSDVAARSGVVLYDPPPGERIDDSEATYSVQNLNRLQKAIVRTQWNNLRKHQGCR